MIHTALRKTKIGFTYFWQSREMSPCPHTLGFTQEYQALQEDNIPCQYCASEFSGCLWTLRLLSPIPQSLIPLAWGTVWDFVSNKFSGRAAAAGPGAIPEKLFPGTGILTHLWKKSQLRLETVYLKCHRICLVKYHQGVFIKNYMFMICVLLDPSLIVLECFMFDNFYSSVLYSSFFSKWKGITP